MPDTLPNPAAAPDIANIPTIWGCRTCKAAPWDCGCPRSFKCEHCEWEHDDMDYRPEIPAVCEDSPDGTHKWVDTTRYEY